jgi:hypothetical protein
MIVASIQLRSDPDLIFLILQFLTSTFLGFVLLVRYFSHPAGQTRLRRVWKTIATTRLGQKVFYVTPTAYPAQPYK